MRGVPHAGVRGRAPSLALVFASALATASCDSVAKGGTPLPPQSLMAANTVGALGELAEAHRAARSDATASRVCNIAGAGAMRPAPRAAVSLQPVLPPECLQSPELLSAQQLRTARSEACCTQAHATEKIGGERVCAIYALYRSHPRNNERPRQLDDGR